MKTLIKTLIFLFTVLTTFYACDYPLKKENIIHVEPPQDTVYFNLSLTPEHDTIEIFTDTDLSFEFNSLGLTVLYAEYSINNSSFELYSPNGEISIDPDDYLPGYYTLKLTFMTNSGSGSIADNIGYEGYLIEKEWTLLTDGRPAPYIVPEKSITENRFIKISWPECDQYNFEAYEFSANYNGNTINLTITDPDQNYYIDSLYVCGDFNVSVDCRVAYAYSNGEHETFHEDIPQLNFEEIGYDSLRIFWNKTNYNAKYRLVWDNDSIYYFNSNNDTTYTTEQIGFGKRSHFELCTQSIYIDEWPASNCNTGNSQYYNIGTYIAGNFPEFGYNHQEKVFYTNTYDDMECYDINTFDLLNTTEIEDLLYGGSYSCPTNSSKVATTTDQNIYIYDNKNLVNPNVFQFTNKKTFGLDHFLLTDNDYVALTDGGYYKLFNIETHNEVLNFEIDDYPYYSKWACITTSQDAKFACIVTMNGIHLYNLESGTATLVHNDTRAYRSAYFNPYNPNELFLTLDGSSVIEKRNPNDFSLVSELNLPSQTVIQNVDPVTGYVLVTDYSKIYIVDPDNNEIKFSMNSYAYSSKFRFYNYVLFSKSGYVLNIYDAF